MDFKLRLYEGDISSLSSLHNITLCNITIIDKNSKFERPRVIESNAKKFGYTVEIKGKFLNGGGSHSSPCITFKGKYIDIIVRNFPRYPSFYQCKHTANNIKNGYFNPKETLHDGFPVWEKYRQLEITLL